MIIIVIIIIAWPK